MRQTCALPGLERRMYARITLDFTAELSTDGAHWSRAHGKNISESGMMLLAKAPIDAGEGDLFYVRIFLPRAEPIFGPAKVVRVEPRSQYNGEDACRIGARFCGLSLDARRRLRQFVRQHQEQA